MPLSFQSLSHGEVVFGFYNIETDGLLLDRQFFFCTDFCRAVIDVTATRPATMPGWVFADAASIGDLMGAIHGLRYVGFLGEAYRRWPFPATSAGFRQRLRGAENRQATEEMLARHSASQPLSLALADDGRVTLGEHLFSEEQFEALVTYVDRGGYPTWERREEGCRPDCVVEMVAAWAGRTRESGR